MMLCGYPFRARAQATTARKPRPLLAGTFSRIAVPLARAKVCPTRQLSESNSRTASCWRTSADSRRSWPFQPHLRSPRSSAIWEPPASRASWH
eukprot:scaffold6790_cov69-Phaeocystis_antarctica.AAC.8